MEVRWFELRLAEPRPLAIVLDSAAEASGLWPALAGLTRRLLARGGMPDRDQVFVLGNPAPLSGTEFSRAEDEWLSANRGRARIIAPVFDYLAATDCAVAVLCSGHIWDLEDWLGQPLLERTRVVGFGPGADDQVVSVLRARAWGALRALRPLVETATIRLHGARPVAWDDPTAQLADDALVVTPSDVDSFRFGLVGPGAPVATGQGRGGQEVLLPVGPGAAQAAPWRRLRGSVPASWDPLPEPIGRAVERAGQRSGRVSDGLVIVEPGPPCRFVLVGSGAWPLPGGRLAVRDGDQAAVLTTDGRVEARAGNGQRLPDDRIVVLP